MTKIKKRVLVGMSGGVDSSVTAALLKEEGYDVIGITMQLLAKEDEKKSACCNLGAVSDAKRVAEKLGIPHYTVNSRAVFEEHVLTPFKQSYMAGQTPNPCVECNRHIKFDELLKKAKELNADFIATGHYCQILFDEEKKTYSLNKAIDSHKDQSYFLYMIPQNVLKRLLFPLGKYRKPEIREIASNLGLINAKKKDSQDICFVGHQSYKNYLKKQVPDNQRISGTIEDINGTVLGEHDGIYQFTIGQRRGLNISAKNPLYVLHINPNTHVVTVGEQDALKTSTIKLNSFTKCDEKDPILNNSFEIKIRYKMESIPATVTCDEKNIAELETKSPIEFLTPGQSCVIYDGNRIVGGGIIQESLIKI
ncbi:tRNA 2-thiouridine(34) synthase MnmA [Candidatus Marinamargulisbacteria bacterium SCGC AG-439-L15]|nr:tRNA 2-thiouridine(34) synthase MnmA [Candidatus Marinamargulisbacteria bacterium SCGC AG-439-L15]